MISEVDRNIIQSLWGGYADSNFAVRFLAAFRTLICPFAPIALHIPAGSRVLDIGCGTGAFVNILAMQGHISEAVGCDVSQIALSAAKKAAKRLNLNSAFHLAASTKELPDDLFDVVCLIDVVHHVPLAIQHQFFIDAASRVKPGGIFIYKEMADHPAWKAWANRLHDLIVARDWINYAPVAQALLWAKELKLVTIAGEQYNVGPYAHELVVLQKPLS